MAIILSDNILTNSPKPLDSRYGPWSGVTDANNNIPDLNRYIGLTVGIITGATTYVGGRYLTSDDGIGEYWYYTGVTNSDLVLKPSGGGVEISVSANTGLGISDGTILFTTYNPNGLEPTLSTPYAIGGIPSGTTVADLSGDTLVSLFTDLLFPTVQPTYTIPAISINGVNNTLAEVGTTISLSLSTTGITNDAGRFTQLRLLRDSTVLTGSTSLFSGTTTPLPTQFGYADPNNPNEIFSISSGFYSESYTLPAPVSTATNTTTFYKSDGNYESGLPKLDSKGSADIRTSLVRNSNAPQLSANTFNSTTYTYTNIYPYFWGVTEGMIGGVPQPAPTAAQIVGFIESGTSNKVLAFATNSVTVNYIATGKYMWVAFFENYPQKNNWFITDFNKGTMGPTDLFGTPTKLPVDSPTVGAVWSNIQYNIYVTNYASAAPSVTFSN